MLYCLVFKKKITKKLTIGTVVKSELTQLQLFGYFINPSYQWLLRQAKAICYTIFSTLKFVDKSDWIF
jgi:hypothetical protein